MDRSLFSLNKRVVLVTGDAGHLGSTVSLGLARMGTAVHAVERSEKAGALYTCMTDLLDGGYSAW